ncbi:unnamed protein product [Clonostachys solani]|uniref:NmrA-like domain-containing protein n=1 Tax=Clonostachys solani TaxID=160281 RepID=A0A9N9W8K9_9HYPO|nr:unnamed protein product [Clonostachys solani]
MSLHITVFPASTQSGKEAIRALLESDSKSTVKAIYRNPAKAPVEFKEHPNFEATQGDVATGEGLDFSSSQAILYIPPVTYDGTDQGQFATQTAQNVKEAIQRAPSLKKLILHSAMGAQHDHGTGVLRLNHISDRILESVLPEVQIVKPGWFFENWTDALKTMRSDNPSFESTFSPPTHEIPMLSVKDVGDYLAQALLDTTSRPGISSVSLFGPRHYSSLDVKEALEQVTGNKGELITIEKDRLATYFAAHVPPAYAQEFADMVIATLLGGTMAGDFEYGENTVRGKTELVDGLRELYAKQTE